MKPPHPLIQEVRQRIDVLALVNALEQHALGGSKMSATQVSAALALLKKVMPDISSAAEKNAKETTSALSHEDALKELE